MTANIEDKLNQAFVETSLEDSRLLDHYMANDQSNIPR